MILSKSKKRMRINSRNALGLSYMGVAFLIIVVYALGFGRVGSVFSQVPDPEVEVYDESGRELLIEETLLDKEIEAFTNPDEGNAEAAASDKEPEADDRISLDLKGIDITEVFRLLSLKTGLTIVPGKNVKGRINIFLNNVTFRDALDVILITQGLASEQRGNILMIMTNIEYSTRYGKNYDEKRQIRTFRLQYAKPASVFSVLDKLRSDVGKIIVDEASGTVILIDIPSKLILMGQTVKDLDQPLDTAVFDLQYANADDIKDHLSDAITSGTGELYIDERTSKLVVSDLPERMSKIKRMIHVFDEEARQVFIEAEIVQITLNNEYQRGIDWEETFTELWLSGLRYDGSFPTLPSFTPASALTSPVGTSSAAVKMQVGTLTDQDFTITMEWLETFGETKILSRPKIAVMNNEEAKILVGTREAYVTQTLSQAETTTVTSENIEFVDVGVKLNVVPTINKEGFIMMKIKPEVSSVSSTLTTQLGSTIPIIETSESETVVKVKDGTIIMIAGLLKEEKREDVGGTPFLSKIPIIGGFFGSRAEQNKKTELIIFLKPRIITGEATVPGTEPERVIHPDLMPDDMRKSIMEKELQGIKVSADEMPLQGGIDELEKEIIFKKGREKEERVEEGLKGFKEF